MSAARELLVVPPDGPLTWLFPALRRHDRPAPPDALDMREGMDVADVLTRADGRALRVQHGPRGGVVLAALRAALRRAGRDDVPVAPWIDPDGCLEARLLARSTAHPHPLLPTARELDGVPFFATDDRHPDGPVQTRLQPGWWGVLPGDIWPDDARAAWHTHLRATVPELALQALAFENHALAGVDLFFETLTRGMRLPTTSARSGPLVIGIDGIDGAGKSTHLTLLEQWLTAQGLRVARHKIYRHGVFHDTVTDMTRACRDGHALHLWPLQRHAKLLDSLKVWRTEIAPTLDADVLLFDRYVETHLAAGTGRYHHDPQAREMLMDYPRADVVFVLDLPVATSLARLAQRTGLTVDENPYMLQRFRTMLLDLATARGHLVLDATGDVEALQQRMRDEVQRARTRRAEAP